MGASATLLQKGLWAVKSCNGWCKIWWLVKAIATISYYSASIYIYIDTVHSSIVQTGTAKHASTLKSWFLHIFLSFTNNSEHIGTVFMFLNFLWHITWHMFPQLSLGPSLLDTNSLMCILLLGYIIARAIYCYKIS